MFQVFFDGIRAIPQAGFLLGGLLMLGLGLAIAGHEVYWQVHAIRVDGVLSGVRTENGFYYSVYRYVFPATGASIEATSSTGSTSLSGRATGKAVRLMVMPDNPEHAEPANSWLIFLLGMIVFLSGGMFLWISLRFAALTPVTWLVLGVFVLHSAFQIKKWLRPPAALAGAGSALAQWKTNRQAQRRTELQAIPVVPTEQIQDAPKTGVFAARATQLAGNRQQASPGAVGMFLLLFGSIPFGAGCWMGVTATHMATAGVRAPGIVMQMEAVGRSPRKQTFRAIVRFVTTEGQAVIFRDKFATRPALYDGGESVIVLYLPENPQGSAMIDHGIWKWVIPGVLIGIGGLLLVGGKRMLTGSTLSETPHPSEQAGPITRI